MNTKMKIYTLTFQFALNYGAILQAYALYKYLVVQGHDVKIIDYWPEYAIKRFLWYSGFINKPSLKSLLLLPHSYSNRKKYDKFIDKHIKLTDKCYNKQDVEKLENADIVIVGSDQVWNPVLLEEFNDVYFLNFKYAGIKASYAASAGQDDFTPTQMGIFKDYVARLDFVSVRERQFCTLLHECGIKTAVQVLDPVFLLDSSAYELLAQTTKKGKYILTYYTDKDGLTDRLAQLLSKQNGNIPIYKIGTHSRKNNIVGLPSVSIEEFLGLFKDAEYVVTSSFHGTAFSIIFKKQFYSITAGDRSSRLISLLSAFDLMDRYIATEDDLTKIENKNIDYIQKERIINVLINDCKNYIHMVLSATQLRSEK